MATRKASLLQLIQEMTKFGDTFAHGAMLRAVRLSGRRDMVFPPHGALPIPRGNGTKTMPVFIEFGGRTYTVTPFRNEVRISVMRHTGMPESVIPDEFMQAMLLPMEVEEK